MSQARSAHRGPLSQTYSARVLVGNWAEERQRQELAEPQRSFEGVSVSRATYTPDSKYGAALAHIRSTPAQVAKGSPALLVHRHDAQGHSSPQCLATMYQLTHGDQNGKVQQQLWQGHKRNDANVPVAGQKTQLLESKRQEWAPGASTDLYTTAARAASADAWLQPFGKQQACRPAAEGGQPAQLGRKAKGCFVEELDKSYQRLGLRK